MNTCLLYVFKVSLALSCLQLVYYLFLRKLTFYATNRFVLLSILGLSCLLPLFTVPEEKLHTFTSAYLPVEATTDPFVIIPDRLLQLDTISGWQIAYYLYWIGVLVFFTWFLIRLLSLGRLLLRARHTRLAGYVLIDHPDIAVPFSFFNYLGLNKEKYSDLTLQHIIQHERIHICQWHTIDILLSNLYTVFFWCNPFAWIHQRLIYQNLEYIADNGVLGSGIEQKSYLSSLLSINIPPNRFTITNSFASSSIKNRIHMIYRKNSPKMARFLYLILPIVASALFLFFNISNGQTATLPKKTGITDQLVHTRQEKRIIKGIVKDADTGLPMANVKVTLQRSDKTTTTTMEGNFAIEVDGNDQVLEFSYVDLNNFDANNTMAYQTAAMQITPAEEMTVLLAKIIRERNTYTDEKINLYFIDGIKVSQTEYDDKRKELEQKGWIIFTTFKGEKGVGKFNMKTN
jgi:hypothetical protein